MAHSSSGLGHRPLKAEITGSNPVCATKSDAWESSRALFGAVVARAIYRMIMDSKCLKARSIHHGQPPRGAKDTALKNEAGQGRLLEERDSGPAIVILSASEGSSRQEIHHGADL